MRPFKKTIRHHDSVLGRRAPETKDVPDDAVVPLADDELEGARLPGLTAALAPASRARGELDATSRDEEVARKFEVPRPPVAYHGPMKKSPTGAITAVDRSWIRRAAAREPSFDSLKVSSLSGLSNLGLGLDESRVRAGPKRS